MWSSEGEQAVSFSFAVLISVGSVLWIVYGSYGLAMLPLELIKGEKSLSQEKNEICEDLTVVRTKQKSI